MLAWYHDTSPSSQKLLWLSTFDFQARSWGGRSIYFLPPHSMLKFKIRFALWTVEAENAHDAKAKVLRMIKTHPEDFFTIEEAGQYDPKKRPVWKMFLGL
jgi:hypothetical protein